MNRTGEAQLQLKGSICGALVVWVLLAVFVAGGLVGCQRRGAVEQAPDVVVTLVPAATAQVGEWQGEVVVQTAGGEPIEGAQVALEGNMTHAGMQPTFAQATALGGGHYGFALPLTMAGDWVLSVRVTLPDGRVVGRDFEVLGVAERQDGRK